MRAARQVAAENKALKEQALAKVGASSVFVIDSDYTYYSKHQTDTITNTILNHICSAGGRGAARASRDDPRDPVSGGGARARAPHTPRGPRVVGRLRLPQRDVVH